jgi:hypothetical protein
LLQRDGLSECSGGTHDCNPASPKLIQYLLGRNSEGEAEGRHILIQKHLGLILKTDRLVRSVAWESAMDLLDTVRDVGKAALERAFVGNRGARIFHRRPQVDRKWFGCETADLVNHLPDRSGRETMAPNDPSPPKLETAPVSSCDDNPPSGP